jgi:hypothetical protein
VVATNVHVDDDPSDDDSGHGTKDQSAGQLKVLQTTEERRGAGHEEHRPCLSNLTMPETENGGNQGRE